METCCVRRKKSNTNKSYSVRRTKQNWYQIVSNYYICILKKSRFVKYQEVSVLFSKLGIRAPLSNIPLIGDFIF